MKNPKLACVTALAVLSGALVASGASPASAAAETCGLLSRAEVRSQMQFDPDVYVMTCQELGPRFGQWGLECGEKCTPPWNAVESLVWRVKKGSPGRRYIRRFLNRVNDRVLGEPALAQVRSVNPTHTSNAVYLGNRRFLAINIFSYEGAFRRQAHSLAVEALRRYR